MDELQILMIEVERYLAAVEAFRAEGYEPRWRSEDGRSVTREQRLVLG